MSDTHLHPGTTLPRLSEAATRSHRGAMPFGATLASVFAALLLLLAARAVQRPPTAAAAGGGCSVSRPSLNPDSEEADLLRRLNDYRIRNGLAPLTISPALMAAAAWKSADLGANGYFAHDDLGRSWLQRIRDCGYTATANVAENLAAGNADGASTFQQWQSSSGHNANMLNAAMRVVGVARAYSSSSPFGWYWTAEFGAAGDGPTAAPTVPAQSAPPAPPRLATTADVSTNFTGALVSGATAIVSGTGDCLRVHDGPTVNASVVGCLPDGTAMVIAAGPIAADGFTWWRLGGLGWAVGQYLSTGP
ncbi:MAG TPA: CAP domain-containing protein [Dehalococcoidia bacterium]|nr:CAP domain-containing protein [Dehalococcoidia bacterium]